MSHEFLLTLISNDLKLIEEADRAGVDRIGIDIERLGKRERQADISDARISDHELSELFGVAGIVRHAEVFVRLNPWHSGTPQEVETAIAAGGTVLMLPYFKSAREVAAFVDTVAGRATVVLLLETAAAAARLHEILAVPGVSEIMVGLNDLHRSCGLANHFELLGSDLMVSISRSVRDAGLRFGFGGVARPSDRFLPVPAELVISQYPRLVATSAWLSRSFLRPGVGPRDLAGDVAAIRQSLADWAGRPIGQLAAQRDELQRVAATLAQRSGG